ncbi:tetratricopeptide repeat protein [Actinospica sp.]|uniref:tetratricopeptide repeat protein n=1 Tax=Actinospica sp. TaxID=1872142 RepID=UPI002B5689D2|nr:tetratricopeptide repeat protein [Actinospica sp.]HWG22985.1 tetratricopeptide repeat protein [Actinospica sp.]
MSDGEPDAVAAARAELAEAEGVFGPDHPHVTKLRIKLAEALNSASRHAEELPLRERVLADLMAQHGADHNDTAVAAHNYGYCLYANDRPDEGITYIERARRDIAPFVKPQGPALFFLCRNLATVYQAANRTGDAIALLEEITDEQRDLTVVEVTALRRVRVKLTELYRDVTGPGTELARTKGEALWHLIMRKQEESAGPDDPETLRDLNLFAVWYAKTDQQRKALPLYQRTLATRERVLGREDSETLLSRSNLGICHAALGEREAAVKLFEPLYEQRVRLLGEEHEDTLDTLDRLAVNLYHRLRYQDAAKHFARLMEIRERLGGTDDRERATYLHWLGWSHYHAGYYGPAITALRGCLTDRERILGPVHKDTIAARHDVGDFYQARQEYDEAIPVLEQALAERERVLGPGDADTVKTRSVLAKALSGADRDDECADRRRENVAALEREHGADAPETIQALLYLGYAEKDAYRYDEAAAAYTRALASGERALGPEHTDTVEARRCLAYRHMWAGRFAEAIPLFERVLENFRRNLGDTKSKTLEIRWSLARCSDGSGLCDQALAEYAEVYAAAERAMGKENSICLTLGADLARPPAAWRNRDALTGRRLWQVALGAVIVAEVADQGHPLDTLYAGRWLDGRNTAESLRRWWGITSRQELLDSLESLESPGQRARYAPDLGHEALAWDVARYANNVRDGVTIGWLGESEAWELLDKISAMTAQTYDSWDAYVADYLAGRQLWLGDDPDDWPLQHRRKIEAAHRLLDPANAASVFNRAPWGA